MAFLTDPITGDFLTDPVSGAYLTDGPTNPHLLTAPVANGGTFVLGSNATVTPATWIDGTTITKQWYRSDIGDVGGASEVAISGEIANTHLWVLADVGKAVYYEETATNVVGSTVTLSNTLLQSGSASLLPILYYYKRLAA